MLEYLIGRALAQEAGANVVVFKELKYAFFIQFPKSVLGHSTMIAFYFMTKIDLVYFKEDWANVTKHQGNKLIKLNIKKATL